MKPKSISAFFPCYNDASTIQNLVVSADKILKKLTSNYEIIVVNDGSFDESAKILQKTQTIIPKLKVITHHKNRGYGAALISGFANSSKELVFYTDGDGQYNVSDLPILFSCLTNDIDVVNGIKISRQDDDIRILLGNAYKSIVRNLFNLPIYDVDCDFRLIRNKFLKKINLKVNSGAVCVELVKKLQLSGAKFREVSIHHYPRLYGKSAFFNPKSIFETAFDLFKLVAKFPSLPDKL